MNVERLTIVFNRINDIFYCWRGGPLYYLAWVADYDGIIWNIEIYKCPGAD